MTKRRKGGKSLEEYFEYKYVENLKVAVCKLCFAEKQTEDYIKMTGGNTTGVKRHLEKFHKKQYNEIWEVTLKTQTEVNLNLICSIAFLIRPIFLLFFMSNSIIRRKSILIIG